MSPVHGLLSVHWPLGLLLLPPELPLPLPGDATWACGSAGAGEEDVVAAGDGSWAGVVGAGA
jgi:hypothetical protein